jgi:hypothetical protein
LIPEYSFAYPGQDKSLGVKANGGGVAGELAYWLEGRPLRGYFLKAHVGYRSIRFKSDIDVTDVPATNLGFLFGGQSIYGGWFTFAYGIGVIYDLQSEDRTIFAIRPGVGRVQYIIPASGALGNGFDFLLQLSLGGSF